MSINLLPKWVIPEASPSAYDTESLTMLESIAKTRGKMNELVEDYNNFVESWNRKITEFQGTTQDELRLFESSLRQEFQDFIDVVNIKYEIMDETIVTTINSWLASHPEATTTVQPNSLTDDHLSDDLKIKTIKEYVTPEMYGAKGDGITDDSEAIQNAINTGLPCILYNKYLIEHKVLLHGNRKKITIEGELIVSGDCGIEIKGSNNIVDGNGQITVVNEAGIGVRLLIAAWVATGNVISVRRMDVPAGNRKNNWATGVEIVGNEEKGGQCFDIIKSEIWYFRRGIWAHDINTLNSNSWYTAIYIDSVLENCTQAVVLENAGGGGFISGGIQPRSKYESYVPDDFNGDTTPLVYVESGSITINTFIWDMWRAINTHAIEIEGEYNVIESIIESKYLKIPPQYLGGTSVRRRGMLNSNFPFITARAKNDELLSMCSDSSDVLLGALDNSNVICKMAYDGSTFSEIYKASSNYRNLFNGSNESHGNTLTNGTLDFLFEFNNPIALRAFCLWGYSLPDESVTLEIANVSNPDTFIEIAKCENGVDYVASNGDSFGCAKWLMNTEYNLIGGTDYERKVKKVKVRLKGTVGKTIQITRLSLFSVDADIMKRSGGRFEGDVSFIEGRGLCLTSPNGSRYRISVSDDGTLTATKA